MRLACLTTDWKVTTPEEAAKDIHRFLGGMAPIGRMVMLRTVRLEFDPDAAKGDAFRAGLEHGQSAGLFTVRGLALLRVV